MSKTIRLLLVGLSMLLLVAVPAAALAQEEAEVPRWPLAHGRVEAILSAGFVLSNAQREVTVSVDAETAYRVPGVEDAGLDDLKVGDTVLSLGRRDGEGGFLARVVGVLPPMPFASLKGVVIAIEGPALTVTTVAGEKVVSTDDETQFSVPDVDEATLADIGIGDRVFAIVLAQDDRSLLAKSVAVIPDGALGPIGFRGRVTRVSDDKLDLSLRQRDVSVGVTADTRLRVPGVDDPSMADIRVGDWVLVVARLKGPWRVEATAVAVVPAMPAHRYVIPGEVIGIDGTTLTVQDPNDQHLVMTDEQTQVRIQGVEDATVADIELGDQVLALGQPQENHSLLARLILVKRPEPSESAAVSPDLSTSGAPSL